jgi:hypothetical protein
MMVTWMSFASVVRELRRDTLTMQETHIVMSSLIFHLALSLMLGLTLLVVLCLVSLMDLTITFGDDKKGKVLGTGVIKINDHFTLNDVALVDRLRYNLLFVSQLVDADLHVLF